MWYTRVIPLTMCGWLQGPMVQTQLLLPVGMGSTDRGQVRTYVSAQREVNSLSALGTCTLQTASKGSVSLAHFQITARAQRQGLTWYKSHRQSNPNPDVYSCTESFVLFCLFLKKSFHISNIRLILQLLC